MTTSYFQSQIALGTPSLSYTYIRSFLYVLCCLNECFIPLVTYRISWLRIFGCDYQISCARNVEWILPVRKAAICVTRRRGMLSGPYGCPLQVTIPTEHWHSTLLELTFIPLLRELSEAYFTRQIIVFCNRFVPLTLSKRLKICL
jgi:hypothetical protein